MNHRRPRAYLILLLVGLSSHAAIAASPQARGRVLPVEEMVQKSDVVGVATVQSATTRRDDATGLICTDYQLAFSDVWKGEVHGAYAIVKAGGELGGLRGGIAGQDYQMGLGERIVVFSHPSNGGNHVVVGLRQGLYRVGGPAGNLLYRVSEYPERAFGTSSLTLAALKAQVARCLGRAPEPEPPSPAEPRRTTSDPGSAVPVENPPRTSNTLPLPVAEPAPEGRSWAGWLILGIVMVFIIFAGMKIFRGKERSGIA